MSDAARCAELAERFLDGDLDDDAWGKARSTHGPALDKALAVAQARRDALATLPRPTLPSSLRDRLLIAQPPRTAMRLVPGGANPRPGSAPPPNRRRQWWHMAIPTAIAAIALVAVLISRDGGHSHDESAPLIAKHDQASQDEVTERERAPAAIEPPQESKALRRQVGPASQNTDEALGVLVEQDQARAEGGVTSRHGAETALSVASSEPAPVAAPQLGAPDAPGAPGPRLAAGGMGKAKAAPGGGPALLVAAVWHVAAADLPTDGKGEQDKDRADSAKAFKQSAPAATGDDRAVMSQHPPDAALAAEARSETLNREAAAVKAPPAANERALRITLRNPGNVELRLPPGAISLAGISQNGRTLWKTVIHGERETVIPPGETVTWDEPVPVIPPGAAHLRVEVNGVHSAELAP